VEFEFAHLLDAVGAVQPHHAQPPAFQSPASEFTRSSPPLPTERGTQLTVDDLNGLDSDGDLIGQLLPWLDEAVPAPAAPAPAAPAPATAATATATDDRPPEPAQPQDGDSDGDGDLVLSPVVRKLLKEHDLEPGQIEGTGQGGRITRADVLAYIDEGGATSKVAAPAPEPVRPAAAPPAAPPAPATERPTVTAPAVAARSAQPAPVAVHVGTDDETVPFTNIRRRTAEHMVRSKATSAHVLTAVEVDFERVDRVRRAVRDEFKAREGFGLTYLPFIARAVVDALREFPKLNASVGDDALVVHHRVHLGIAVDLNFEGLLVPVIRDAQDMRLPAIAREVSELAAKARAKQLSADDISGGTFTITNPGPFGTFITAPVINQPQVAILSTDGVKKKPVAIELPDGSDSIAIHPVGILALTFDHRANDGAYASAFLAKCREIIETRDWSQEV
jgi:2-oxoglutarate dehydrogenase E2 component (dihydrolipoamide succinyltransferase)